MPYACTINEPQIVAFFGYRTGDFPPGRSNALEWSRVTARMIEAHEAAVRALKSGRGAPLAGICLQMPAFEPARDEPASRGATEAGRGAANLAEVRGAAGGLARLCGLGGPVLETRLGGDRDMLEWRTTAGAGGWVRAEVRRTQGAGGGPGEMVALTNPVLLGTVRGPSGPPPA